MLKLLLNEKNMSVYKLEKSSNVCHATLNDLYNEKTNIEKCSSSLLYSISKSLNMSMDKLYSILSYKDLSLLSFSESFDLFKSNVCHELVDLDYKMFLKKHLANNSVEKYYKEKKYLESLYLLSMIDYLCITHNLPIVKEYSEIREHKMEKLYVSKSVYLLLKNKITKITDLYSESIDTFMQHNIMEANIYDVR